MWFWFVLLRQIRSGNLWLRGSATDSKQLTGRVNVNRRRKEGLMVNKQMFSDRVYN